MDDNLEERVERLENFMGDIDKIVSVYANSVQEICDKYLNLLYIEDYDSNHPNYLNITGFLSELTNIASLPKNVMFNMRASHTFAYDGDDHSSKLRLTREDPETHEVTRIDLPLKKYDVANPGNLMFLEPGDFLQGILYGVYINSQGIAIISSNDAGTVALEAVTQLQSTVSNLAETIAELSETQTVGDISANTATIANLTVSTALTLSSAITLPTGSTCSSPANPNEIANKSYVDTTVDAKIADWYNTHHIFGTQDPSIGLQNAPERSIYYKY